MRNLTLLSLGLLAANAAHADLGEIPKQSGWSGFLLGGVNAVSYQSNFYAGDDNHSRINDLARPTARAA